MNLADLLAQLEQELSWRFDEIRNLKNLEMSLATEDDRAKFRKALVVMLYSHYEGYCKAAFSLYAGAVNSENLSCSEAEIRILASSFADVFKEYHNTDRRAKIFKYELPDDPALRTFARQAELVDRIEILRRQKVKIPVDTVVNVESNLKPDVIRKILFRLGLPPDAFDGHSAAIDQLIGKRNAIAHGAMKSGVSESQYAEVERAALFTMKSLKQMIWHALRNRSFSRGPSIAI
jgi:hypothetical protein